MMYSLLLSVLLLVGAEATIMADEMTWSYFQTHVAVTPSTMPFTVLCMYNPSADGIESTIKLWEWMTLENNQLSAINTSVEFGIVNIHETPEVGELFSVQPDQITLLFIKGREKEGDQIRYQKYGKDEATLLIADPTDEEQATQVLENMQEWVDTIIMSGLGPAHYLEAGSSKLVVGLFAGGLAWLMAFRH